MINKGGLSRHSAHAMQRREWVLGPRQPGTEQEPEVGVSLWIPGLIMVLSLNEVS